VSFIYIVIEDLRTKGVVVVFYTSKIYSGQDHAFQF
jgi:hypothetical protein